MAEKLSYFTNDWKDDDRMNFMFSAFPEHRNVNPKHWDSKLQFWRKIIIDSCEYHDELCVDYKTLRSRFSRNGLFPLGLSTVLAEMLRDGWFESIDTVTNVSGNDTWVSWAFSIAKRTVSWTFEKFIWGSDVIKTVEEGLVMVVVGRLKEKVQMVLQSHVRSVEHEATDYIVPWNVVKSRCQRNGIILSEKDLELVMCHLQNNRTVSVYETQDGEKVVKFVNKNETRVSVVNDQDLGILRLKKTIASLTLQGNKILKNSESCVQKAKEFSSKGLKKSALAQLRKKAILQKNLDRTYDSLHTLEELLHRIQQADTDKMIVDTLKAGSSTLKVIQEGLSAEQVDKIMLEIEETIDDADDIQEALAQGQRSIEDNSERKLGYDVDDLEKELAELGVEEGTDTAAHETQGPQVSQKPSSRQSLENTDVWNLPEPPTSSPSKARAAQKTKPQPCTS